MNRFLTRDEFHETIRLAFVAAGICPRTGLRNFNNGPVWGNKPKQPKLEK